MRAEDRSPRSGWWHAGPLKNIGQIGLNFYQLLVACDHPWLSPHSPLLGVRFRVHCNPGRRHLEICILIMLKGAPVLCEGHILGSGCVVEAALLSSSSLGFQGEQEAGQEPK